MNYSSINIVTTYVGVRFHQLSNSATHPLNGPSCSGYRYQVTPVLCLLKVQFIVISAAYNPTSGRHTWVSVHVGRYTYVCINIICMYSGISQKTHFRSHFRLCKLGTYQHWGNYSDLYAQGVPFNLISHQTKCIHRLCRNPK